ncbi:Pectinesterase inhibitor domain containing protein [Melia azedarach]|uniref:Pectinesterase inhibitor domain containing protein n=1 Tax=Melia azedarach TaxID=155640 RepID=A0ACC1Y386_MELAZ|nr:Pectinesterase inhibitor domain containing protein [Melia azedarach]
MEVFNMKSIIVAIVLSSLFPLYNGEATATPEAAPAPAPAKAQTPAPPLSDKAIENVQRFCSRTQYPSECVKSVAPFVNDTQVDVHGVLRAGIQSLTQRLKKAIQAFEKTKGESKAPDVAEKLEVCLAYYRVATTSAADASEAVEIKNYKQVKEELDRQLEVIGSCDDLFAESVKGVKGTLDDMNNALSLLAKVNLAIFNNALVVAP